MHLSCCNMYRHHVHVQPENNSTGNLYQLEPYSASRLSALCALVPQLFRKFFKCAVVVWVAVNMSQTKPTLKALTQELTFPSAIDRLPLTPLHILTFGHRAAHTPSTFYKRCVHTLRRSLNVAILREENLTLCADNLHPIPTNFPTFI